MNLRKREDGPGGNDTVVHEVPQRDQQPACNGDDADPAQAWTAVGEAPQVPLRQVAVWLKPDPEPGRGLQSMAGEAGTS